MKVLVYGHILSVYHITSHHIMPYVKNSLGILFCKREILVIESTIYTDSLQQTCKRKREHFSTMGGTFEDRLCKKKQPFALCIRYTYMKWDGEFLLGTASMLLEARPFLSRSSTSIVQKVKLRQVWDWLTSLGLSQER